MPDQSKTADLMEDIADHDRADVVLRYSYRHHAWIASCQDNKCSIGDSPHEALRGLSAGASEELAAGHPGGKQ